MPFYGMYLNELAFRRFQHGHVHNKT